MTDLNSQAKPGGSKSGSKQRQREELTPEQQAIATRNRIRIEEHQHRNDDLDDYIQETD